ncbi:restriction endonuclease subunit M [Planctomycetales bacterium]|nr:restriction endonuclease subunit M [Planctomycetales bacterium]GHS98863.1 restriction endonuclease subunit M [Planctomycetales bacterium]GHT07362.1 restriction endonuclease subunit M [Planctomycetales bacterium]
MVDLFCGIGGLTHGLRLAGLDVCAGVDIDATCQYAYETNNPPSKFIEADVAELPAAGIAAQYPREARRVLVGCAPCQPFSRYAMRYRKGGDNREQWRLLYSFADKIRELEPEVVSMENVPGLLNKKVFVDFKNCLDELKYHVSFSIVFCPDYGVPQKRRRLVLLASKLGEISLIPPQYTTDKYLTVRDAIGNLPAIKAGAISPEDTLHWAASLSKRNLERIKRSRPGGTWRDWEQSLQLNCHQKESGSSYPSVYGRMSWNEPAPTITTQFYGYGNGRFGHPQQNRALSIREGAMLQSFPRDYVFAPQDHPVIKRKLGIHIGNAVPVNLGLAIGESIQQHLKKEI